jgi:hypothetical protein
MWSFILLERAFSLGNYLFSHWVNGVDLPGGESVIGHAIHHCVSKRQPARGCSAVADVRADLSLAP